MHVSSFALEQITVGYRGCEGLEYDVVVIEVCVVHALDVANMERVCPDSILPHVGLGASGKHGRREGYHLTLLIIDEVTVGILQCEGTILPRDRKSVV